MVAGCLRDGVAEVLDGLVEVAHVCCADEQTAQGVTEVAAPARQVGTGTAGKRHRLPQERYGTVEVVRVAAVPETGV